jgi:hypothetical protein
MAAWCLETIGAPDILLNTVIEYPSIRVLFPASMILRSPAAKL